MRVAQSMKARFERMGFVDIKEHRAVWPLGDWPKDPKLKELGRWGRMGACDSVVPFGLGFLTREGYNESQIQDMYAKTKKDLGRGGSKYYCEG